MSLPAQSIISYNQKKFGVFGELGEGANAKIRFLETVITWDELDKIKLISEIKGSETWDVRDLFQRDVDTERVSKDIVPYLEDLTKIKYFSPITLILLPMGDDRKEIIKDIKYIEPKIISDAKDGEVEIEFENIGFYKFSIFKYPQPIAEICWSDVKCNLVAIDGQHRLSALKEWENKPNSNFSDWKIPVVILNIFQIDKNKPTSNLLEMVRKTFVYINSKAKSINKSREILLNDESVNSIGAQEIIAKVHENDNQPIGLRDKKLMPLILFDWQGKVINSEKVVGPASIISVEELVSWLREYIIGEDNCDYQQNELRLLELIPPLNISDENKVLNHNDTEIIRKQFKEIVLPGILYFLANFKPFENYIAACRKEEETAMSNDQTGNVQHAFLKLRFGSHNGSDDQREAINAEYVKLKSRFEDLRVVNFDSLLKRDVGLRGVIYAFGECKSVYQDVTNKSISWLEFANLYVTTMNTIQFKGIFKDYNTLKPEIKGILEHLAYDPIGQIINYKIENVKDGLGGLLLLMSFGILLKNKTITEEQFDEIWGDYSEVIKKSYEKGERKKIKSQDSDSWKGTIKNFNKHVNEKAVKSAELKLKKLESYILKF